MTSIQPELWVERAAAAVAFYEAAFGATVMHSVGDGDDIVAQLSVGDAAFWVDGWRLGRIIDPFGNEWEIGRPLGTWPPA
jgi:PhnB protein